MNDLLKRLRWSQADAAKYFEVTQKTMSLWCTGNDQSAAYRIAMKHLELVVRLLNV